MLNDCDQYDYYPLFVVLRYRRPAHRYVPQSADVMRFLPEWSHDGYRAQASFVLNFQSICWIHEYSSRHRQRRDKTRHLDHW